MPTTASASVIVAAAFLSCIALASPTVGDSGRTSGLVDDGQRQRLLAGPGDRAGAMPVAYSPVAAGGSARPIAGWVRFCRIYVDECRVDPAERDVVRLTPALWRAVNEVNAGVNAAIRPLTDVEHWGELDRWDLAEDGKGDCEDYQLLKRRKLVMLGIPRRAMVMTVVLDERNDGHAVLMLRTDRGDLILDNKRDEILSWHRTGYVYVKRESQTDASWVSLNHVSGVGATASR